MKKFWFLPLVLAALLTVSSGIAAPKIKSPGGKTAPTTSAYEGGDVQCCWEKGKDAKAVNWKVSVSTDNGASYLEVAVIPDEPNTDLMCYRISKPFWAGRPAKWKVTSLDSKQKGPSAVSETFIVPPHGEPAPPNQPIGTPVISPNPVEEPKTGPVKPSPVTKPGNQGGVGIDSQPAGSDPVEKPLNPPAPVNGVHVLAPNGGETVVIGQALEIKWTCSPATDAYAVYLSTDGGKEYTQLNGRQAVSSLDGSGGVFSYSWIAEGAPTKKARVRVIALSAILQYMEDSSDANFEIAKQGSGKTKDKFTY